MSHVPKAAVPVALAALAAAWAIFFPPLLQVQAYHLFADTRALPSIANAADTLSNLAFLVVGFSASRSCGASVPRGAPAASARRRKCGPTGCSSPAWR